MLLQFALAAKCTEKDCCVPPPNCKPGNACPAICYINTNCEGDVFDICKSSGPTRSVPSPSSTGFSIPPKPTATVITTTSVPPTTVADAANVVTAVTTALGIFALCFLF